MWIIEKLCSFSSSSFFCPSGNDVLCVLWPPGTLLFYEASNCDYINHVRIKTQMDIGRDHQQPQNDFVPLFDKDFLEDKK